jgi:hypothetical protein
MVKLFITATADRAKRPRQKPSDQTRTVTGEDKKAGGETLNAQRSTLNT